MYLYIYIESTTSWGRYGMYTYMYLKLVCIIVMSKNEDEKVMPQGH